MLPTVVIVKLTTNRRSRGWGDGLSSSQGGGQQSNDCSANGLHCDYWMMFWGTSDVKSKKRFAKMEMRGVWVSKRARLLRLTHLSNLYACHPSSMRLGLTSPIVDDPRSVLFLAWMLHYQPLHCWSSS